MPQRWTIIVGHNRYTLTIYSNNVWEYDTVLGVVSLYRSLWVDSILQRTQGRKTTGLITERRIEVTYRPLPEYLELRKSPIHGYGVFAVQPISQGDSLGLSHINAPELIRTPLGGYINHSMNPNCMRLREGNRWYLTAISDIRVGEEITLMYKGYRPWRTT